MTAALRTRFRNCLLTQLKQGRSHLGLLLVTLHNGCHFYGLDDITLDDCEAELEGPLKQGGYVLVEDGRINKAEHRYKISDAGLSYLDLHGLA